MARGRPEAEETYRLGIQGSQGKGSRRFQKKRQVRARRRFQNYVKPLALEVGTLREPHMPLPRPLRRMQKVDHRAARSICFADTPKGLGVRSFPWARRGVWLFILPRVRVFSREYTPQRQITVPRTAASLAPVGVACIRRETGKASWLGAAHGRHRCRSRRCPCLRRSS